ncbi:MAG TPA: mannosyltransferase family protein [Actinomycetota bacterium]|nr:mannosyltransferase family protein [Actinomycetota bacterium]
MGALGAARASAAATRTAGPDPGARAWRVAAALVVVTRVALCAVAWAAAWYLADGRGPLDIGFLELWNRWDARHFLQVAEYGYTDPRTDPHASAFFPLFPLVVRALSWTGLDPIAAGMLVSLGASIVACAFLVGLAERDEGRDAGPRAALYLLLAPTAVFLVAPYSEALFLAGAIPAFHYARAGRWRRAGLCAAIAVATRFAGVFVLAGLAGEALRARATTRGRDVAGALALGALPLVAYGAYLARVEGSPFHFFHDQRVGWLRAPTNPVDALRATLGTWGSDTPTNWMFAWRIEVVAAVVGLALVGVALARREWGYAAFMGATMAALVSSTWLYSIPRMLVTFFPAAVWAAGWTRRDARRHEAAIALLAPFAALGAIVFTRNAWFY